MNIYLLRHGETIFNRNKVHQKPEIELTEKGIDQIKALTAYLKNINVDAIFSSPLKRATQTAQILSESLNKEIKIENALKEIQRPTVIIGKNHNDPETIQIKKTIKEHYHIPDWKYSDEENFLDLKKRVDDFKNHIQVQKYENVVLVSHGMAIKMFLALVIFGDKLQPLHFLDFYNKTSIANGGLSLCSYIGSEWKLIWMNKTIQS